MASTLEIHPTQIVQENQKKNFTILFKGLDANFSATIGLNAVLPIVKKIIAIGWLQRELWRLLNLEKSDLRKATSNVTI